MLGGQRIFDARKVFPVAVIIHQNFATRTGELRGDANSKILQKAEDVAAPTGSDRGRAESILQDQVPTDNPCEKLSQGCVSVSVRRPGNRYEGGKLRVA